jgi:hypothetical protein
MMLQEENRIRGTREIGCRHTTPSPGLRPCWSGYAGVPMQPSKSGDGGVSVPAVTRVDARA